MEWVRKGEWDAEWGEKGNGERYNKKEKRERGEGETVRRGEERESRGRG